MGRRTPALLALGVALALAPFSAAAPPAGGTFLVAEPAAHISSIDAALGGFRGDVPLYGAVCASLMYLPDKPLHAGLRVAPELASGFPKISPDGKTYVFTIRTSAHFNSGAPVTAADVAYTINRDLNPALKSSASYLFQPIVGAQAVLGGKATNATGVTAAGNTLTIRLTHPVANFVETAARSLCVLPAGLPIQPRGVTAPVPSAAPYFISEYVPAQQIVLERNTYYQGPRPQHVDRIVFDLTVDDTKAIDDVLSGSADYAWVIPDLIAQRAPGLVRRFAVNKSRFFVEPLGFLRMFALNTSGPLFRDNAPLRQAINYAVERTAIVRQTGVYSGTPTDQFLPPVLPGFTDAHIYPLAKPDLAKARALAKGNTRSGKLVLYWDADHPLAQAQIVKQDLARIGLKVEIRSFPAALYFTKIFTPGEPFDMAYLGVGFGPDPGDWLTGLFDGALIGTPGNSNLSYFDSPAWNRALRQASRLTGQARYRAFGKLDVQIARDAAPAVAYGFDNALTVVSARTGCVVVNPELDLAAACLR
jgi:peptide/nickel transport system substrate-binding protein